MIFLRVSPAGYCKVCFSACGASDFLLPPSLSLAASPLCLLLRLFPVQTAAFDEATVKTTSPPLSCSESFLRDSVTQSYSAVK